MRLNLRIMKAAATRTFLLCQMELSAVPNTFNVPITSMESPVGQGQQCISPVTLVTTSPAPTFLYATNLRTPGQIRCQPVLVSGETLKFDRYSFYNCFRIHYLNNK